jgi:hypothetical protein
MRKEAALLEFQSQFEHDAAIIYVLDSNLNVAWCNGAWDQFAVENGGANVLRERQIGRNVLDVTPSPLLPFYEKLYASVLGDGKERNHLYECSSDRTVRRFHMHVARKDTTGEGSFLVVVNSLILEAAQRESGQPTASEYDFQALQEDNGFITMCSHCRRTRVPNAADRWVWVPDLVRKMPRSVSHGLCLVCFNIHYGI